MGSGVNRVVVGAFVGDASARDVRSVGFRPKAVEVLNVDGLATGKWTEGMADGDVLKQITAGTISLVTTNGVTPLSDGFRLGADADLNAAGETVHWIAHE